MAGVNAAFKKAADGPMKNVLAYSDAPHCLDRPQGRCAFRHRRCPMTAVIDKRLSQSHGMVRQQVGLFLPCAGPDQSISLPKRREPVPHIALF